MNPDNTYVYRKTKTFVEERVYERPAGSTPLDETINEWVLANQATIVTVSAPGMDSRWLDKEMTKRSVLVAITVIYEGSNNGQWPERK